MFLSGFVCLIALGAGQWPGCRMPACTINCKGLSFPSTGGGAPSINILFRAGLLNDRQSQPVLSSLFCRRGATIGGTEKFSGKPVYMKFKMSKNRMFFGWSGLFHGLALLFLQTPTALAIGPPPAYTAIPTNGVLPVTVQFTGPTLDSFSNAITSWNWSFGDGVGNSTLQNPTYTYTNLGLFTPALTVSNAGDGSSAATGPSITVLPGFRFVSTAGALNTARYYDTATLLPNGLVLAAGGYSITNTTLASAELFNPASGTWAYTGSMNTGHEQHTATLLTNGLVLVAGGFQSAELYNPVTGTWTTTGSLITPRYSHTATLLDNGLVLIAGGYGGSDYLTNAELYNPVSGTWTATGSLNTGRQFHTATLLTNGQVLVAGGDTVDAPEELYNPVAGTWTYTGSMNTVRQDHTATLLPDGQVLVAGGVDANDNPLSSAQLYNPATGTWTNTGSLNFARASHTATLLPNGMALAAGGSTSNNVLSSELYDPAIGTWTTNGLLPAAQEFQTATLLPSGELLVAAGTGTNGVIPLASSELLVSATNSPPGTWTLTNAMNFGRNLQTATLLTNGQVLIAGGFNSNNEYLASGELFNPATGTWTTNTLNTARDQHTATLLTNGLVLVAGGYNNSLFLSSAELFNASTGAWIDTGSLNNARDNFTSTLLTNGLVLAAGGADNSGFVGPAELYDPVAQQWTVTGSLNNLRYSHTATLLTNGLVLVAGGYGVGGALSSSELYNPASGTWTNTGSLNYARYSHTATLLPNGMVLAAGGVADGFPANAELYNPASGAWTVASPLNTPREQHTATLLPNGQVLITGGYYNGTYLSSTELYDPAIGTWQVSASLNATRDQQTATLLADGQVLVAGGTDTSGLYLSSAELFIAGLGFSASWQPQISSATPNLIPGGTLAITGSRFRGISEGSGGNSSQDSPADYPVVQLRSLESSQTMFLSALDWASNSFTSAPVKPFPPGYALVTAFVNGIPSTASIINVGLPLVGGTVQYTASPTNGTVPLTVQFNSPANDSNGNAIESWNWTFGDGNTSTNQNPTNTYNSTGLFTPSLTVSNFIGNVIVATGPAITVHSGAVQSGLVLNGGFETGDFTGWTLSGNSGDLFVANSTNSGIPPHTGSYLAILQTEEGFGYLSQNLATVPGSNYLLSFWLNGSFAATPNELQVSWAGNTVLDVTNFSFSGWTNTQLTLTATGTNTVLQFGVDDNDGYIGLDDVDVAPLLSTNYIVTVAASPTNGGTASGGGTFVAGSTNTVTAAANGGYTFANWTSNGVVTSTSPSYTFTLSANVTLVANFLTAPPQILVLNGTNTIANGQTNAVNFGVAQQNQAGSVVNFTVTNAGGQTLDLESITVPSGYSLNTNYPSTIVAGGNGAFSVQLITTTLGTYSGLINISNNAPPNNPYVFAVTGTVTNTQPPVIVTRPTNQNVPAGNLVTFAVIATGAAPLTYQWLFDATNLTDNSQIAGSQSNVLTLTSVTTSNAGTYEVVVSNAYGSTNAFATLTVSLGIPVITWAPASIIYGTPLGSNQLNATASVPGSFAYTPTNGSVLSSGNNTLSVVFTPNDTVDYTTLSNSVNLFVAPAPLTVTASNVVRLAGVANPVFGGVITGTNFADNISATYSCNATAGSPAGTYPITPALVPNNRLTNYVVTLNFGTLTISAGVILTSPANGQSFSAPATIPFAATATLPAGVQSFALYTNSVLVTSSNSVAAISTVLSNVPSGSYQFTAVATDNNNQTHSEVVYVTVNVPGTTLIDFDALDTSLGVMNDAPLSSYLSGFGVTITNVTFGTSLEAATGLEAISQNSSSSNELPVPSSLPNLFTQVGSSQPVTFTLNFAVPLQSFGFTRVGLDTNGGTSGISHPAWSAHVLDDSGNELQSVSEPLLLSSNNIPARTFSLVGGNIASVRFDSDSQDGTAATAAVLLDNLLLNTNATNNPLSITLAQPSGGTAPANISLSAIATDSFTNIDYVAFYSGPTLIGSVTTPTGGSNYNLTWTNVLNGTYIVTAQMVDAAGYAQSSAPVTNTVASGGNSLVVNFDAAEALTDLPDYLAANGLSVASNSSATTVLAENQNNVAGGGFVIASSQPNLLTQTGSNGPVSFTVDFTNLLGQFSFTRPELLANPFVTHPAWQVQAFDALGQPLASVAAPQISSSTNVPAQTYTLSNTASGAGIASVEFNSEGTGLTTFNAMLLDDFVLDRGSNLPPSVVISSPTNGQVFTSLTDIPIIAETAPTNGSVSSVTFYAGGSVISNSSSPFSIAWNAPSNGAYALTAVASNNLGLSSTSAPVLITIATSGFAIVTPPTNQTVGLSNNATFSVTTSPTNGVSYQWQFNGTNISGATLSSYTTTQAQSGAAGSYVVVATYNGQSITSQPPAVLTVLGPPAISSPLSATNVVVNIGSNVTLNVSASDAGAVSFYYQWQRNGQFLAGATNSYYTISNAQPSASGNYQALVANAFASQESPVFAVSVNFLGTNAPGTNNDSFATSLSINPTNGPVAGNNAGSPTNGELARIAGKPAGRFLWFNWTANFTGVISLSTLGSDFDTLLGVYTGTNVANLTTNAADDDSAGYFDSLVSFNCVQGTNYQIAVAGYRGASGNVVLYSPSFLMLDSNYLNIAEPVITQQPTSQIVQAGATVTLSTEVSNATTYLWYFANAPVTGGTAASLVISNFPASAAGVYYLRAANGVGSVQSQTVGVQIQNASQTTGSPTNLCTDKFGDAVDLTGANNTERFRPEEETGGFTLSQSFSTVGATKEEGEPNHAGQPGGASYWYSYTAPGNGTLEFSTAGSTFSSILAVYTGPGDSFSTLVNVGAAFTTNYVLQGQPVVVVTNVTTGTKYFIAIDGYLGASGASHLGIVLTAGTNATAGTNTVPVTNDNVTLVMTSPENNLLTTSSNLTVRGTVKGVIGVQQPFVSYVQMAFNGGAFGKASLGATNIAAVLTPEPGGAESVVAQEGVAWSSNVTLVPGANVITAQSISVQNANAETASLPVTHTVFLVPALPSSQVKSTLTLLASPSGHGRISGQPNQANLEINKVYTVKAVPIGNWIFTNWTSGTNTNGSLGNSASLSFIMTSNLILQANFITNPFTAIAGVYNGLFSPGNGVTAESSGFFTATLPATGRGAYSARLLLDGGSYPFSGTFDLSGDAEQTVARSGNSSLTVDLHLNLATPDDQMTGSIINSAGNGWTSTLLAGRADFNARTNPATNSAGRYTLIFPPGPTAPTSQPGGYGYATLTNNLAGHVALSGRLADNAAVSQSVSVSKDGNIPLYVSLYSRKGLLMGWLTLTNNSSNNPPKSILGANLAWIKPGGRAGTLYAAGFTNTNITVLGSFYSAPQAGANNFALTNGTLTLSNGGLTSGLVFSNLTITGDKLNAPGNEVTGTITPGTGVLTLTFRPSGASSDITAKGVVLQDGADTNAAGWFLGADQSGFFLLQQ
jgi:PKD repeat protein